LVLLFVFLIVLIFVQEQFEIKTKRKTRRKTKPVSRCLRLRGWRMTRWTFYGRSWTV